MKQAEDTKTVDLVLPRSRGPYAKSAIVDRPTFGAFVAMLRKKRGMTQAQYAGAVNISRRTLNSIECLSSRPRWVGTGGVYAVARYEFRNYHNMAIEADKWMEGSA